MLSLKYRTIHTFQSKHRDYASDLFCLILDKIVENLSHLSIMKTLPKYDWCLIQLTSQNWHLLSTDVFWDSILEWQIKTGKRSLKTQLGRVVSKFLSFTVKDIRHYLHTKSFLTSRATYHTQNWNSNYNVVPLQIKAFSQTFPHYFVS